jgi:hypothetical protein
MDKCDFVLQDKHNIDSVSNQSGKTHKRAFIETILRSVSYKGKLYTFCMCKDFDYSLVNV